MADNTAYLAFLRDPDQDLRRAELTDFFGPNAATFLKTYDRLRESTLAGKRPRLLLLGSGFEVAAFFLGPVWFFYRKMWAMAWVIVGLLLVIAFLPVLSRAGLILGLILAMMAHRTYVQHAVSKLQTLRGSDGTLDPVAVRAAGGVSRRAGILSGVIFGILTILGIVSIIYLAAHGIPPR